MSVILFEALLIVLLVAANGVFAMSEMAVVSSRRARLQRLARGSHAGARAALDLADNPDRFLSTVQIGITMVGILAGAFGGATIAGQIASALKGVPALAPYGEAVGIVVVVLVITYLSLIFGELVPKRLALNRPERIAAAVARPMGLLSALASPFVRLLSASTAAVFKLLRVKPSTDPPVTEEEIRTLIEQGTRAGVFEEAEQDLVESVFRLGDRRVSALMTPRLDIVWLDVDAPEEVVRRKVTDSHFSRFPVCRGGLDDVVGFVKAKEYLAGKLLNPSAPLSDFINRPLFVPESCPALRVLELFKSAHTHMALVVDEYGSLEGLFTTNDVLEAIVGDVLTASVQSEPYAVRREDGSWLLDGALPVDEFKELFSVERLSGEERGVFRTLAGFIFTHLGRVPSAADSFEWNGLRFEIVDMDGKRIDKVLVTPTRAADSPRPRV
jgi:putative hemolysin